MRIHSKKALRFDHPGGATQAPPIFIAREAWLDVPEWVAHSKMFELATADKTVTVIESKADEKEADGSSVNPTLKDLKTRAQGLGIKGYTRMDEEELAKAVADAEAGKPNAGE